MAGKGQVVAVCIQEQAPGTAVADPQLLGGPERLRAGAVSLVVRDAACVEAFYRDVIGLQVISRGNSSVHLGAGGTAFLELLHRPDALPDDPAAAGLFHTALLLPSRMDLGRWLSHIGKLGQSLDGAADHLVSEAAYLSDPEGNGIEVYADRPREGWRWTEAPDGRRVGMANLPLDAETLMRTAATPWAGAPEGTRIGHVHLRVGDVAEAKRFYGGALGMELTAAWPAAVFFATGGYHHHVAANTWRSLGAGRRDPRRAGLASVTMDVSGGRPAPGQILQDPWGTTLRLRTAVQETVPFGPAGQ